MTKFTPGPWTIHSYNNGHLLGFVQGAPMPDERYGDAIVLKFARPTSARAKADARLIAAAPTMYEYIESSASNGCAAAAGILETIHANR
jgi:hypothetical protein